MAIAQTPSPLMNILAAKTYNAAWFSGTTPEAQISAAIAAAVLDGATAANLYYVFIPANFRGFNPALVAGNAGVQLYSEDDLAKAGITANTAFGSVVDASAFQGATNEAKITAAIAFAKLNGFKYVLVGESMLPYTSANVTYDPAVQLTTNLNLQPGVYDARAYGGLPNAGAAIQTVAGLLPVKGGVVDAQGFTGNQIITTDMLANVTIEKPIKFIFGPSVWSDQASGGFIGNFFGSNIEINGNETTFIFNDGQNQSNMFSTAITNSGLALAAVVNGSASVTLQAPLRGVVPVKNKFLNIYGHVPNGGQRDNTTLNGAIDNVQTNGIVLTSTTGLITTTGTFTDGSFAGPGALKVDNEIITYTSFSGNTLVGVTRGAFGSVATSHLNLAGVDRVVWDSYIIRSVTGSGPYTLTLDRNVTCVTMTAAQGMIGPHDISFTGTLTLDGGRPASDTTANGIGLTLIFGGRLRIERTVTFQNWDHCGVFTAQHNYAVIDGQYFNCGTPALGLGFTVLFFQGSKSCTAYGDYENSDIGPACDDRTTNPSQYDNSSTGCIFLPRTIKNVNRGVVLEGTSRSFAFVPVVDTWGIGGGGYAVGLNTPQWVTSGVANGNTVILGFVTPIGQVSSLAVGSTNNSFVSYTPGATILDSGVSNTITYIDSATVTHFTKQFNMENGFSGTKTFSVANATQDNPFIVASTWAVADTAFKIGFQAQAKATHTSGSQGNLLAIRSFAWGAGSGGTTTNAWSIYSDGSVDAGAIVTSYFGAQINAPGGAGTVTGYTGLSIAAASRGATTNVGLNIGSITGTGAVAIQTALGVVKFGDQVSVQQGSGTQSVYVALSPDASVQTNVWGINNGSAAVPGAVGTVTNNAFGFRVNNLVRANFDTSGNLLADTTNGGTFQDRLGSAAAVSKHVRIPFQASGLTTVSAADVSVSSFNLPANALAVNGQAVRLTMRGSSVTQAGVPNIKFGATVIATGTVTAGNVYEIDAIVTRTGAATQIAVATIDNGTALSVNSRTTPAETLSGAITIDFRGSIPAGGTLNVDYVQVEYMAS